MSIRHTFLGIVVLATSSVIFAQTTETKPPDKDTSTTSGSAIEQAEQAAASRRHYSAPAQNPCSAGANVAEILTDTMGVDFGPYLTQITKIVRQNWYNLMPPSVYPPIWKQGKLSIEFVIQKDGKVSNIAIRNSSGDVALDLAAWGSLTASSPSSIPFPPLPKEFPGQTLGLRFNYFYNSQPSDISIGISPCVDVRVPAGSTLKFVASGKHTTDASVTWSVSGSGCSKSACGTISDTGLYTAPVDIPDPPTVIVEATSRTDNLITARSKVTVVQANPSH